MDLLSSLPTELLMLIIAELKVTKEVHDRCRPDYRRLLDRKLRLAMSETNRRLWSIARPFLYHEIDVSFKYDSDTRGYYHPTQDSFLLYRSIHEDRTITSYVHSLDVDGLSPDDPDRTHSCKWSSITYTSNEIANLLKLLTNVDRVCFYGCLGPFITNGHNQIILSSVGQMPRLHTLWLELEPEFDTADVIHHILSAVPNTLK
jgi:hypothetical protein